MVQCRRARRGPTLRLMYWARRLAAALIDTVGNVLASSLIRVVGLADDVIGVIEKAFDIESDLGGVELSVAHQARPTGGDDVGSPSRVAEVSARHGVDGDVAIDHWDQIAVGDAGHGLEPFSTVDATENEVVVECNGEAFGFADAQV